MVAISLYRGNLHRVPDVPRRWLMPTAKISLKDFKSLLFRRNRALFRVRSPAPALAMITLKPNPDSNSKPQPEPAEPSAPPPQTQLESKKADNVEEKDVDFKIEDANCLVKPAAKASVSLEKPVGVDGKLRAVKVVEEKIEPVNPKQTREKVGMLDEKEKRKREVEEKLQTLNAKKHNLVQALKQILNVEEELKRRSVQGMVTGAPGSLQVDTTNDSGLMTRHVNTTPRTGSEANLGGDMEGAETEDASNQNTQSRHMLRMSSMSPSSESPLRRPAIFQHNVVPHPSRTSLGATGSPSRFAPTSHQGHPGNLPAVSVSGTNYIASSPSPAASGGTSVFREARQPSPWN